MSLGDCVVILVVSEDMTVHGQHPKASVRSLKADHDSYAEQLQLGLKAVPKAARVRRQLFLWIDDNYFSRSTTITF